MNIRLIYSGNHAITAHAQELFDMGNSPSSVCIAVGMTAGALALTAMTGLAFVVCLLRRVSASVGTAPPTSAMVREENAAKKCALYRHFPNLNRRLAWRSLGAADETPIHICRLNSKNGHGKRVLEFLVKREDLISIVYGGNKVRTLQHQLAVCEAKREAGQDAYKHLVSVGSGGSNQVVATVVLARSLGWNNEENTVIPFWFDAEAPDLDNTLNLLSVLSFPIRSQFFWGTKINFLETFQTLRTVWCQKTCIPMMLGGNCPVGVLGQAGAIIELAEQIQAGKCPDLDRIYVPIGSSCTVSGLALGVVLVRTLGLPAFRHPDFKIVGCNVHDRFAMLDRRIGVHKNPMLKFMPLNINHTISGACQALKKVGGPDVEKEALNFVQHHLDIRADAGVIGKYGAHSETTRTAAQWYDEKGEVTDYKTGAKAKELWICGHFVAKAFTPLLEDLEDSAEGSTTPRYMLWMTKSAVQPRGQNDEWTAFQSVNDSVKTWAYDGKAQSPGYRPGSVTDCGKSEDYRSIMTQIK